MQNMYQSSPLRSIAIGQQKRDLRGKKGRKNGKYLLGGGCRTAPADSDPKALNLQSGIGGLV